MRISRRCAICKAVFVGARNDKKTCSQACKKALQRGGWKTERDVFGRGRPRKARQGEVKGDKTPSLFPVCDVQDEDREELIARRKAWPQGVEVVIQDPGGVPWCAKVCWLSPKFTQMANEYKGVPVATLMDRYIVSPRFLKRV